MAWCCNSRYPGTLLPAASAKVAAEANYPQMRRYFFLPRAGAEGAAGFFWLLAFFALC